MKEEPNTSATILREITFYLLLQLIITSEALRGKNWQSPLRSIIHKYLGIVAFLTWQFSTKKSTCINFSQDVRARIIIKRNRYKEFQKAC